MPENDHLTPILRTKLRPPRVTSKVIQRRRLDELLDGYLELPVTLVSAPAGYGKSTLVAEWLATCKDSSAWLSLEKDDSDLPVFLRYLLEAIEKAAPGACNECRTNLIFQDLPPAATIARLLVNELDSLSNDIVVVLDDYQLIHDNAIHELLTEVLRYPPAPLHLVIISRADPPLPLASVRAAGRLGEVRAKDLQFTTEEVAELLSVGFDLEFDEEVVMRVQETTEGWPVALHLTALSLRDDPDAESVLVHLGRGAVETATELVREVLSALPAEYRDCLVRLSVLDRFSAPLCEVVCAHVGSDVPEGSGVGFMSWLERSDLFVNVLDDESAWYRFHHIFRDFLTSELEERCDADEVLAVHRRVAIWFEENGLLDEALKHYLVADDFAAATALIRSNRQEMMNREQWDRLDRWLRSLPPEVLREDIELQVQRAWSFETRYRHQDIVTVLSEIDQLLSTSGTTLPEGSLLGEIDSLKAFVSYALGEGREAADLAHHALDFLVDCPSQRGFAHIIHSVAHQSLGDINHAEKLLLDALSEPGIRGSTQHGRLLMGLCWIHWFEADIDRLANFANELLAIGHEFALPESVSYGGHFLGVHHIDRGDSDAAAKAIRAEVDKHSVSSANTKWYSTFLMALILDSNGEREQATELTASVSARALAMQNPPLIGLSSAFQAELDLRQGRLGKALAWARSHEPTLKGNWWRWYLPDLTYVRALMAEGIADNLKLAREVMTGLDSRFRVLHNRRMLIDVLALRASLEAQLQDPDAALASLCEAVELARPYDVRRPFLDLGEETLQLLQRLPSESPDRAWVEAIIESGAETLRDVPSSSPPRQRGSVSSFGDDLFEPLTDRELDVLELLAERLTNKEIGSKLHISAATVKRHTVNIYGKLGVGGRREAVGKAGEFGIL